MVVRFDYNCKMDHSARTPTLLLGLRIVPILVGELGHTVDLILVVEFSKIPVDLGCNYAM